jgi:uncharacterized protein YdhG (YjbR/CyaY superfamily)
MKKKPAFAVSESNKPIAALPKEASPKYQVEERARKVGIYSLSTSEILTLSVLNPAAACLLGWGINVAIAWSAMASGTDKHTLGIAAAALLIFGGALQCLSWGLLANIWRECRSSQPKAAQVILKRVRSAIRKAVPKAQEVISYKIPAYQLHGSPVLYFAGWKQHYSLYPANAHVVAAFKNDLAPYELSKGTIRFPLTKPVPVKLIERVAKFRAKEVAKKAKADARRSIKPSKKL